MNKKKKDVRQNNIILFGKDCKASGHVRISEFSLLARLD